MFIIYIALSPPNQKKDIYSNKNIQPVVPVPSIPRPGINLPPKPYKKT